MFKDVGKKIKMIAKIACWIGVIISAIGVLLCFSIAGTTDSASTVRLYIILGFAILIVGPVISWVNSIMVYGFGELIDKTCDIERSIRVNGIEKAEEIQELEETEETEETEDTPYIPYINSKK